jgi:hypothetical protein
MALPLRLRERGGLPRWLDPQAGADALWLRGEGGPVRGIWSCGICKGTGVLGESWRCGRCGQGIPDDELREKQGMKCYAMAPCWHPIEEAEGFFPTCEGCGGTGGGILWQLFLRVIDAQTRLRGRHLTHPPKPGGLALVAFGRTLLPVGRKGEGIYSAIPVDSGMLEITCRDGRVYRLCEADAHSFTGWARIVKLGDDW